MIPHAEWTHAAHFRIGAWRLHHHGTAAALGLLPEGIRRLNDTHGPVNSATSGYHETITAACVRLLDAFLARCDAHVSLPDRVMHLLTSPAVAERTFLLRFWSRDVLTSERARREWVPPDLALLALP